MHCFLKKIHWRKSGYLSIRNYGTFWRLIPSDRYSVFIQRQELVESGGLKHLTLSKNIEEIW